MKSFMLMVCLLMTNCCFAEVINGSSTPVPGQAQPSDEWGDEDSEEIFTRPSNLEHGFGGTP